MTNMNLMRAGLVTVALAALPAAVVRADTNADIDAIYARITEGIRTGAADFSRTVYADDAVYLGSFPGPIDRGATVRDAMRASAARLKANGATMTISFRRASRQRQPRRRHQLRQDRHDPPYRRAAHHDPLQQVRRRRGEALG